MAVGENQEGKYPDLELLPPSVSTELPIGQTRKEARGHGSPLKAIHTGGPRHKAGYRKVESGSVGLKKDI